MSYSLKSCRDYLSIEQYDRANYSALYDRTNLYCTTVPPNAIYEYSIAPRQLLKVVDILGKTTREHHNNILFYIYKDGSVECKIVVE